MHIFFAHSGTDKSILALLPAEKDSQAECQDPRGESRHLPYAIIRTGNTSVTEKSTKRKKSYTSCSLEPSLILKDNLQAKG